MMSFVIAFLTVVMVLDCLFLILLVLVQLPKKEAGAGLAFGGGTADALLGAGSGTALTKVTKYVATMFFVLALVISLLHVKAARQGGSSETEELLRRKSKPAPLQTTPFVPAANALQSAPATNPGSVVAPAPAAVSTNKIVVPANPPGK